MNTIKPKISIAMITYNQEALIGRAIDSLICQKEYIYEIIISDDCSEDKTWEVIQEYKNKFPSLIKPFKNEDNLGVYGNAQSVWSKVKGDIMFTLAGDDAFCDKLFENTLLLINENNVDYKKEDFIILFDFLIQRKNGDKTVFSNANIQKYNGFSLKLRNLIFNRSMGLSLSIVQKHFFVGGDKNVSYLQESLIDLQPHMFVVKYYYSSYVGSVYYSQVGISTELNQIDRLISKIEFCEKLPSIIPKISKADLEWLELEKNKTRFFLSPNLPVFFKYFFSLIQNTNFKFGYRFIYIEYKQFVKLILKKLKFIH